MRGMIIKPKPCCGWVGQFGKIIEVVESDPKPSIFECVHCGTKITGNRREHYLDIQDGVFIKKDRVKILPDDLGEELTTENSEEITA